MKKEIYIILIILFLCLFPIISLGKNITEIKLNVYEVTVISDEYSSFSVLENSYKNKHSFFKAEDGNIDITPSPNTGYLIDSIEYTPGCEAQFINGKLEVKNIQDNITITINSRPEKFPFAGLEIEPTVNQVSKDNVKQYNHSLGLIIILIISFLIISILHIKLRNKKSTN